MGLALNNVIWDIVNGPILKIGDGFRITKAVLGYENMNDADIKKMYGDDMIFDKSAHIAFLGIYEACRVPIVCHLVHHIIMGNIKKSYMQVSFDLYEVSHRQFYNYDCDRVYPLATFGRCMPEMLKNP